MIAIVFPKDDIEASDIALKVGLDSGQDVYVVPKYLFRDKDVVFSRLNKSKAAIFLITVPSIKIDKETTKEVKFLLNNGKPVYAIVPADSKALIELKKLKGKYGKLLKLVEFEAENPGSILSRVEDNLKTEKEKQEIYLTPFFLIIAGLLLLYLLSDRS